MKIRTLEQTVFPQGHIVVSHFLEERHIMVSFCSYDYMLNAANSTMSAAEARHLAQLLIVAAHQIEPIESL